VKFTNFDKRMFQAACAEAEKSDYERFHIGCIITYKNKIIGAGHNSNKSHPMQRKYNRRYRKFNCTEGQYIHDSVHAEIAAINSISYATGIQVDWSRVKVFVYRICNGKEFGYGNAKPCPACTQAIRDLGIKSVYFTDDDGYAYLELN